MNTFTKYFMDPIKNHYLDFGGAANRTQYWAFFGFSLLLGVLLNVVTAILGQIANALGALGGIATLLVGLAILLPSLAIAARRLRDAGFSPWLLLLCLIPGIGGLIVLILLLLPSKN